ncbi:hypothetical protein B8W66_09895 [Mycobacterium decipiens]|uniref:Uncharacterized protein n=1 Tax=Mycobacterium decipiens TaxID=1430326 RepID=A0A1X2LVD9_9MYCO|nr:hypothetical protein B8W66_09895 [Mycobacterium decipiens]
MLTSNVGEAYGFVGSRPELELPDLELIFAPPTALRRALPVDTPGHGVVFGLILLARKPRPDHAAVLRGVDRLRVADASVVPRAVRGHTHAPSVQIGEKAAALIRA